MYLASNYLLTIDENDSCLKLAHLADPEIVMRRRCTGHLFCIWSQGWNIAIRFSVVGCVSKASSDAVPHVPFCLLSHRSYSVCSTRDGVDLADYCVLHASRSLLDSVRGHNPREVSICTCNTGILALATHRFVESPGT